MCYQITGKSVERAWLVRQGHCRDIQSAQVRGSSLVFSVWSEGTSLVHRRNSVADMGDHGRLGWAAVKITSPPGVIKGVVEHCWGRGGAAEAEYHALLMKQMKALLILITSPYEMEASHKGKEVQSGWNGKPTEIKWLNFLKHFNCTYLRVQIHKHECGHACSALGGQKKALDPLKLRATGGCEPLNIGTGNPTHILCKNSWTISPVPQIAFIQRPACKNSLEISQVIRRLQVLLYQYAFPLPFHSQIK